MITSPLSEAEIRSLPPLVDIETASRALTISRSSAYALARSGQFPLPVLRIGPRALRVRAADLRRFLLTASAPDGGSV